MSRNKFDVDEDLNVEFNLDQVKRLLGYVKPYKRQIIFTVLVMLICSVTSFAGPYLIKIALDTAIPNGQIPQLILLTLVYIATLLISAYCLKLRIRNTAVMGQSIIQNLRRDLFTHLQLLPFDYYDSRPHGKILVRVVNYINTLSDLLSNGIINLITDLFTLFVIIFFMFALDYRLTLVSLTGLPLLAVALLLLKNLQRKLWQRVSRKQSNMNAYIHESICGIKVTQSFARERVNLGIFQELNDQYRTAWLKAIKIIILVNPLVENVSTLVLAAVYLAGVLWLVRGTTVGVLIAFISYINSFWFPIFNLANFYNSLLNAAAYIERIFETMDEKPSVTDNPGARLMPPITGLVEFVNVSFAYEEGEEILHEVSFTVQPGETIALVGPTGAGKTTIVNLISRFYDVTAGRVLIDGIDLREVTLKSLRSQMGVMLQDTFIFSGTIMDNIRYSRLDATDEQVIAAAKAVKAHDFIEKMEEGYYTQVNERGARLSVGERQLISFTRALLADPRILILDEATSSIDTETELLVQQGLERLLANRTSFIIAHRLSTIKNADRIMYIDQGGIVEAGTHEELMKKRGVYYRLYLSQYQFLEVI
ncbi:MAG TPA: ABC transporter ATP-binding protein [Firmicutes bacterium]|nr:ABC transporter ATP-binding protein [Bacillota bacterium]